MLADPALLSAPLQAAPPVFGFGTGAAAGSGFGGFSGVTGAGFGGGFGGFGAAAGALGRPPSAAALLPPPSPLV